MNRYEIEVIRTSEEYQKELERKAEYEKMKLCPECGGQGKPFSYTVYPISMPDTYVCECGCVWRISRVVPPMEFPEEPAPLEESAKNGLFKDVKNPFRKIWF